MYLRLLILLTIISAGIFPAAAHENDVTENELKTPEIIELPQKEDDLYSGTEIVPLIKEMSVTESAQENSSDVAVIDDKDMPQQLDCADSRLKAQVERFIYKNINKEETNSVPEKRRRLLLVRNMTDLKPINEDEAFADKNFGLSATLAYLKIGQHRQIKQICKSSLNGSKELDDIYVVIYPFAGYYKVVVTNFVASSEQVDNATFIFNW